VARVRDFYPAARIEVPAVDIARLASPGVRDDLIGALRELGYTEIYLDLEGYARGKMNPKELTNG